MVTKGMWHWQTKLMQACVEQKLINMQVYCAKLSSTHCHNKLPSSLYVKAQTCMILNYSKYRVECLESVVNIT